MTALVQAESFLRNRKWIVGSSTNLREALAYIIQKKPQYVLVSADHPNRKVRILPKMLVQAFPCRVIAFAEKGSSQSTKVLHEMALEYNLYPPVSGPSIERMILKIRREDELRAQQSEITGKQSKASVASGTEGSLNFRGDTHTADALKSSFDQARAALTQLISSDTVDETGTTAAGSGSTDSSSGLGSGVIIQQGVGLGSGGIAHISGNGLGPKVSITQEGMGGGHGPGGFGQVTHSDSGNFHEGSSDWDSTTSQKKPHSPSGLESDPHANEVSEENESASTYSKKNQSVPIMESGEIRKNTKGYRIVSIPTKNSVPLDSIIIQGTEEALEQTVQFQDPDQAAKVQISSHLACIHVKSESFSGYLLCALGENRQVDKTLIDAIQKKLFQFLKTNNVSVKEEDTLQLQIQQVDFTDWALEQAQFLKKTIHGKDEIAMAFFPCTEPELELDPSISSKMMQISLRDLKPDATLEFDLYIFMPQNNKYLLYTPKGKPFYGHQQGRLEKKGVTHMHLRKEAAPEVRKYQAQNFLNSQITDYKTTKKQK
ncbi:MAG: hypothetical protein ACAH59_12910 [Pseudobdellovibrionaceae bacterium]